MAANAYRAAITEYGADPRDRLAGNLLRDIWTRLQGARTHPYGPMQGKDPSITWNGLAAAPQAFHGLQTPGGTPYTGTPMLADGLVEGPLGDPARRIFAQRLARRTTLGGM